MCIWRERDASVVISNRLYELGWGDFGITRQTFDDDEFDLNLFPPLISQVDQCRIKRVKEEEKQPVGWINGRWVVHWDTLLENAIRNQIIYGQRLETWKCQQCESVDCCCCCWRYFKVFEDDWLGKWLGDLLTGWLVAWLTGWVFIKLDLYQLWQVDA